MDRKEADAQLRQAIIQTLKSYGWYDDRVLTDYLIVAASQGFDNDGDDTTGYNYLLPEGQMGWHRVIGLLKTVETLMKRDLMKKDSIGEDNE